MARKVQLLCGCCDSPLLFPFSQTSSLSLLLSLFFLPLLSSSSTLPIYCKTLKLLRDFESKNQSFLCCCLSNIPLVPPPSSHVPPLPFPSTPLSLDYYAIGKGHYLNTMGEVIELHSTFKVRM